MPEIHTTENILTIGETTTELPLLPKDATVRVWSVPTEYQPSGYFVSATMVGEPMERPACSQADAELLAELPYPADEDTAVAFGLQQYRESLSCGPVQLRRALRAAGHKAAIDAWIAQADPDTIEDWEYTTEIKRLDPMVLSAQAFLEASDEEVDALFELGKTLA